jgi:hypothetical protein
MNQPSASPSPGWYPDPAQIAGEPPRVLLVGPRRDLAAAAHALPLFGGPGVSIGHINTGH